MTKLSPALLLSRFSEWFCEGSGAPANLSRSRLALTIAFIFLVASGVRLLHWQDSHVEIVAGKNSLGGVFDRYQKEARRMIEDGSILFPRDPPVNGNARMLTHPPGYSILLAAIYCTSDNPYPALWFIQIVCDAAAAVLVLLIATELVNLWAALIGAMLVALSPHIAYYSLGPLPDSLAVVPILIAVRLILGAWSRPRVITIIASGAFVGLSCWFRANALLLAPFLGVVVLLTFRRRKGTLYGAALVVATMIAISPITIRNLSAFHRFIPISIQAGLNLEEGIGDYDKNGRLGMPRSDREARAKDAEWHGRPDYAASLWAPDGIERDRARFARGLEVIRSNPGWFLGVMVRRSAFMLRYNDSRSHEFPFNTANVPIILSEPPFGHPLITSSPGQPLSSKSPTVVVMNGEIIPQSLAVAEDQQPTWSSSPADLIADGTVLNQPASVSLALDRQTLEVAGDDSEYGDQFVSAPIALQKNTDYVLTLPVKPERGHMAIKVMSADRRIALALAAISDAAIHAKEAGEESAAPDAAGAQQMTVVQMPFASGSRTEARLVLSNNGAAPLPPIVLVGSAGVFQLGPTPYTWTRYVRVLIRGLQKNVYTTGHLVPLIMLGIALLMLARSFRTLAILLVVPAYYMVIQSPLHTEYRYILAMHYFLLAIAAVPLGIVGVAISQVSILAVSRFRLPTHKDGL